METLCNLSKIVDQLKGRIALRIKGRIDCKPEPVRDAYYRLMVLSFIVQTGRTMSQPRLNSEMFVFCVTGVVYLIILGLLMVGYLNMPTFMNAVEWLTKCFKL